MKYLISVLVIIILTASKDAEGPWLREEHEGYSVFYCPEDENEIGNYSRIIDKGVVHVTSFFGQPFEEPFDVYIHPGRESLDSTWQNDWNMPSFKSECWMVASGVGGRMDLLSPSEWEKQACEHVYSDMLKSRQLIFHELFHVYHGQRNLSHDFSNIEGIDWFVEGLATYASGQCDPVRLAGVKKAVFEGEVPQGLEGFWSGRLRYGLSGSVVMFIDQKYGRGMLFRLLTFNRKTEILSELNVSEKELLEQWKEWVRITD